LHGPESQITAQRYARYVSGSSIASVRVVRNETTNILNRYQLHVYVFSTKALMQEIANDSPALISRAFG
jgi:hypothetical protein